MIRHFTASGIIIDSSARVLLVKNKHGVWLYPGGHIDPNEDPAEAVHREIREEVAIEVEILAERRFAHPAVYVVPPPFAILVMNVADENLGRHQHIDMVYVCRPLTFDAVYQPSELDACMWVHLNEVVSLDTPPELPSLILEAAKFAQMFSLRH